MDSKKGFVHLILIIGIVLVGIVGIVFLAVKNDQIKLSPQKEAIMQITTLTPTPIITTSTSTVISCKDVGFFKSDNHKFTFECPEDLLLFECKNDVNLISKDEWETRNSHWNVENICRERQGHIQIVRKLSSLYNDSPKTNPSFKVKEEQITIGGVPAIRQYLEYTGANIPPYSQFVTFSRNNTYYRIRVLDAQLVPQFNQILSTFKFTEDRKMIEQKLPSGVKTSCNTDSDCQGAISSNNCEYYCVNNNPSNQTIIDSIDQTCDPTLWDPRLSLECGCINNNCQLYDE